MGDVRFDALDWSVTRNYIRNRNAKPQTAARELHVLRAALHFCRKVGEIEWTPFIFDDAKPPARERWLTLNEIGRLLDACEDDFVKLWTRIALSPQQGDYLSLTTDRVHFDENIIDFQTRLWASTSHALSSRCPAACVLILKRPGGIASQVILSKGMESRCVNFALKKVAVSAGLDDVTPHIMQHTALAW